MAEIRGLILTKFSECHTKSNASFIIPHFIETQLREIETHLKIIWAQLAVANGLKEPMDADRMMPVLPSISNTNKALMMRQCE